jgi:hypothetical protein
LTVLRAAAAIALLACPGYAVVAMVARATTLYWFERWSLAFLVGTAAACALWIAFLPFYEVIQPVWLLSIVLALIALAGRSRVFTLNPPPNAAGRLGLVEIFLLAALVVELAVVAMASVRTPLGWDGLFNFELKARLAFENEPSGQLPMAYLSDTSRVWSHPGYPLLVPFAELWIYSWLGRVDQSVIKILFPLFYFSLVGLVCGAVRRLTDRRVSLAASVALGLLPPLTLLPGAASGYADVPLAAAIAGAAGCAVLAITTKSREAWWLAAILASAAVWTKNEGLLLAAAVGVSAFAAAPGRQTAPVLWMPIVAWIPWYFVQQRYGVRGEDFLPLSAGAFAENIHKLPSIAVLVGGELLRPGHWGAIWPAWGGALALTWFGRRTVSDAALVGAVAIPLVCYSAAFVMSAWPDVGEHMRWSLARLLVPVAPLALIFTVQKLWQWQPFTS